MARFCLLILLQELTLSFTSPEYVPIVVGCKSCKAHNVDMAEALAVLEAS